MDYPPEIERMHQAIAQLPGVHSVCSGIDDLQGITGDDLRLPDQAHLPHGALRRTNGGLTNEALIQFEFQLEPSATAWRSLEFIAWFVRDRARGGEFLQIRPFALPPEHGEQTQLGETLRWHIDLFCPDTGDDLSPQLARVAELAKGLELAIRLYGSRLGQDELK
ncbi:hypothetical protein V5E97_06430 [Singulisphaera sp. Ch08]|uniref:Uncharacterized protein n=1 Tax=Singulisphaera sp. Ch08 TaxID=3120278 RepID=A0AAU7CKH4_9BACT